MAAGSFLLRGCREFDEAIERGALEEAARLYRDDLLSGLDDEWVTPLRTQYRDRLAGILNQLAAACEQRRDFGAAIGTPSAVWRTILLL